MNKKNKRSPIPLNKVLHDKSLETILFEIQAEISNLSSILSIFIYKDPVASQFLNIKAEDFNGLFLYFTALSEKISCNILSIINSFSAKNKPNDYTLLMHMLGNCIDNTWFRYHFIIMRSVFDEYYKKLINFKTEIDNNNLNYSFLEDQAIFLYEMCYDMSIKIHMFYRFKAYEYNEYVNEERIKSADNPFIRLNQHMLKTHKSHSRELLFSSHGVINRVLCRNDAHIIPMVTTMIRQMIELRLFECFGVSIVFKDLTRTNQIKIAGSDFLNLKTLKDDTILPIPLDMLCRIYSWASRYVHCGISSEYWVIYYVSLQIKSQ